MAEEVEPEEAEDILADIRSLLQKERKEKVASVFYFTYPVDGTKKTITEGTTEINFFDGEVHLAAGSDEVLTDTLQRRGLDFVRSLFIETDKEIKVNLDDKSKYPVPADGLFALGHQTFQRASLTATEDTKITLWASTNPEALLAWIKYRLKIEPISIFPQQLYYLQSFGSEDYTFDKAYTHGLFRQPQPTNLDQHATEQSSLDYHESANLTNTASAEVISDKEYILKEARKADTVIEGPCEIGLQLRIRGDGTYETSLDKVRVNLYKRDLSGNDTAIISNLEYDFDTAPTHSADSWDEKIGIKLHSNITKTTLKSADKLVLKVEVFAFVDNASATDNKVRLYFSRGSGESYLYLPKDEVC